MQLIITLRSEYTIPYNIDNDLTKFYLFNLKMTQVLRRLCTV